MSGTVEFGFPITNGFPALDAPEMTKKVGHVKDGMLV